MNKNQVTKINRKIFDPEASRDSCGVGFITNKHGIQTHEILRKAHEALCTVPHRGGMSSEGIGDGGGVNIDLSLKFFRKITGIKDLKAGDFGVANFFYPADGAHHARATALVETKLKAFNLPIILWRDVPVNRQVLNPAAVKAQLPIKQAIFGRPSAMRDASRDAFEKHAQNALLAIETEGFVDPLPAGFYPCSMSTRTQVYKGRLNSFEVIPYFEDLQDEDHEICTLFFHTRFSTNTAPATVMAQPFRYMAHNGELNTDRKNRLSENAIARQKNKRLLFPKGQSDSGRLDQTLTRRINEDNLDIVTAVLAMMPPAWENDPTLSPEVRAMLEYFSLYEEKNDGPAALIFSDGTRVGARLDRLGLRPLRSVETRDYLVVTSEAGQFDFPPEEILRRGRIEAGGMLYFDHGTGRSYNDREFMERLANEIDYQALLAKKSIRLDDLEKVELSELNNDHEFNLNQRHTAYSLNQESFKFLLDPMLGTGQEKVSAMGYGIAPNALAGDEGGVSRYFSQRFAQVTNPPLDSLRESDGMTLRVALGAKPTFAADPSMQLVIDSPILQRTQLEQIRRQTAVKTVTLDALYTPVPEDRERNADNLEQAVREVCRRVEKAAREAVGIIVLSDKNIGREKAAIPAILMVAAANQHLIQNGLRFNSSLIAETGQAASSHDVAALLGFGASAVCPLSVHNRALSHFPAGEAHKGLNNFQKACEKALMKTMGKFGLCTAESYIGGEFFESNYIDTNEPRLKPYFPNIHAPVGGVHFIDIAESAAAWHRKALEVKEEKDIPFLGLFKERQEGAGHTFGNTAVREYIHMTDEAILYVKQDGDNVVELREPKAPQASDLAYRDFGYEKRTPEQIDAFGITPAYRSFTRHLYEERDRRPAALRDILAFPADISRTENAEEFDRILGRQNLNGNINFLIRGLKAERTGGRSFALAFTESNSRPRLENLATHLKRRFHSEDFEVAVGEDRVTITLGGVGSLLENYLATIRTAPEAIPLEKVQPAHEITPTLASGAMSHGALLAEAHEAVAQGTNIAGVMSNSGEGGEHSSRFGTIRASKIKQFASGRFGVWAGYLADPNLEEIEIKIAQGAKPGEGGQLPAAKVTVEIASLRGGTPKVELVSPPPHHDTYSIEDLAQLIHDAKAARVRVVVKLVSSEGIGTIAVGVAKAGADVINVAGNTGGTGAASVTSLKNTGRSPEIGIAEVHQALSLNGLRDKVILRCSAAHQSGIDVVKSAILGADSFEFGTTALMMLRCVMAKNCNVKCPAGLTTAHEEFKGDPRALAQYFMNLAHEVREILAILGYRSLREVRGQTDLLHLINHESMVGQLDFRELLKKVEEVHVEKPIYLEADFAIDDKLIEAIKGSVIYGGEKQVVIEGPGYRLDNRNKTVGGQAAIDIERLLQYRLSDEQPARSKAIYVNQHGRRYLAPDSVIIRTTGSAGQSYAAFLNDGMRMEHTGTCNDGVGKSACGGVIVVKSPGGGSSNPGENVVIGNFALFGASGGKAFIHGEAGDRFAVRNSGAMAVVEGVGDFACEYMTNGAVLNLGVFGKGFCNGMSGGNAYQYDPENRLEALYDDTSVELHSLIETSDEARAHEQFIRYLLEQHLEYTGSERARRILENWAEKRRRFKYTLPLWLYRTQTAEYLKESIDRKSMIEELAVAYAKSQIKQLKKGYQSKQPLFNGEIPLYGETDTVLTFKLVNSYATIGKATEIAREQLKLKSIPAALETSEAIARTTRDVILSESRKLQDVLVKDIRDALGNYTDEQLAVLMAGKRLADYKTSLIGRDVQSIYSLGSTAWIIEQDRKNRANLANMPNIEQFLAIHSSHEIAKAMLSEKAA